MAAVAEEGGYAQCLRNHPIARKQKGMRFAEHNLMTRRLASVCRKEKIRYPPGADLPDEEQAVANYKPDVKPVVDTVV